MRVVRLFALIGLTGLLGAPGISAGDGAGMRASSGGGTSTGSEDPYAVVVATAFLNYDAEAVAGTDGVQETSWANSGTGGSSWDATTAVSGGLTYQQAGDCTHSSKPCLVVDVTGADMLQMPADVAHVWTARFICVVASFPNISTSIQRVMQVSADSATRNTSGVNGIYDQTFASGNLFNINTFADRREDFLSVQCLDATDLSSSDFALAGFGTQTGIFNNFGSYRDPERISLGGRFDGESPCVECEIHQLIAWDEDPGMGLLDLANTLYNYWSN